jgi:hypothetical protein
MVLRTQKLWFPEGTSRFFFQIVLFLSKFHIYTSSHQKPIFGPFELGAVTYGNQKTHLSAIGHGWRGWRRGADVARGRCHDSWR